ncbi:MAG: hypothetical protein FWF45_05575 [Coriobacteriia bacterium]|nr:hypothetical protein [Coriobacteriia bacterium]
MDDEKHYSQSSNIVFAAILDMAELQNGELTFSDSPHGRVHFLISMYGLQWELKFTVTGNSGGCSVRLEVGGEQEDRERTSEQEFALLDSMLLESNDH